MKKKFLAASLSLIMVLTCFICPVSMSAKAKPRLKPVKSITLSKSNLNMTAGDISTLKVKINPSNATNKSIKWSSTDEEIATVKNGKVAAIAEGSCKVIATSNNGKKATCKVSVKSATVDVTSITLSKPSLILTIGDSETLDASIEPSDATDKNITWSSSDSNIATVVNGKVTAISQGNCTITASTSNGNQTKCNVIVNKPNYYKAGYYQPGDIPAGHYVLIADRSDDQGFYRFSSTPFDATLLSIDDHYFISRKYIYISGDAYLSVNKAKLYPIAYAPKVDTSSGTLKDGEYLVGTDIPAGTYTVTATSEYNAYYAIFDDDSANNNIVKWDYFPGSEAVTVINGEIIDIKDAKITINNSK